MRMIAGALALLLGMLAAGCDGEGVTGTRRPARLLVLSGDQQTDTVGRELAEPLVVRVVDDEDRPVKNQRVNFVVTAGGGSVLAGSALTNADGEARERWTLGPVAGDTQRVEARAVDATSGQAIVLSAFRALGVADAPASAVIAGAATRAGAVGSSVSDSLVVRVTDRHGNPVSGVTVAFAVQNGGAVSPAAATTRADGTARSQWTFGPVAGPQTATASTAGFPALTWTGMPAAGSPTRVVLTPATIQFASLDQWHPLTVQAFDGFNNPVAGQQVTLVSQNAAIVQLDNSTGVTWAVSKGNGSASIIATLAGGAADTTIATVRQVVVGIEFRQNPLRLGEGETAQLEAVALDRRDAGGAVIPDAVFTYQALGPAVTVSATGLVTGVSPTTGTKITVRSGAVEVTAIVFVDGRLAVSEISAGVYQSCAIGPEGIPYCWGLNGEGGGVPTGGGGLDACREGTGRACHTRASPVARTAFKQIAVGADKICALSTAGTLYCRSAANVLVAVPGSPAFASLTPGYSPECALTAGGEAWCGMSATTAPVRVAPGYTFAALTSTGGHSCGLTDQGVALCWGSNAAGQLGDGTTTDRAEPVEVAGGLRFVSITAGSTPFAAQHAPAGTGGGYTCGVTADNAAYCWGALLGNGTDDRSGTPVRVTGGQTWRMLSAGPGRTCGITTAGAAYCWGVLAQGEGGVTSYSTAPAAVPGSVAFQTIDTGSAYTCGIDTAGRGRCWGYNFWGQLGDGTTADRQTPTYILHR